MNASEEINKMARATRWKERLTRSGYFVGAVLLHLIVFIMLATVVLWNAPAPPLADAFKAVQVMKVPPPPPAPPPSAGSAAYNPQLEPVSVTVPVVMPASAILTSRSSFAIDASKTLRETMSHQNLPTAQGSGLGKGAGDAGEGVGKASFFGVPTGGDNKRIAFLLDYSGSMDGKFRQLMEKQLEIALKHLPKDTQVIIICWAGPAWLYNEKAPDIAAKWRMHKGYDDFQLLPGATLDPPEWININDDSIKQIMDGIKAQVQAPGGTDWRNPFHYAMKADPQPDTIFFLTDDQIPPKNVDRAMYAIGIDMKKADVIPQINCLWIENSENPSGPMEQLAAKYHGEFRKVSAKSTPGNAPPAAGAAQGTAPVAP